jgi:hypothetical protein
MLSPGTTFVVLAKTDVSEEHIASNIKVKGISDLVTTLAVTNNRFSCYLLPAFFLTR